MVISPVGGVERGIHDPVSTGGPERKSVQLRGIGELEDLGRGCRPREEEEADRERDTELFAIHALCLQGVIMQEHVASSVSIGTALMQ